MAAAKAAPVIYEAPEAWNIYRQSQGLVLGFHGCDEHTAKAVFRGHPLTPSTNDHDWLGNGIYFWEGDPWRALAWACDAANMPAMVTRPITRPCVVGAVLDLGRCCNLMEYGTVGELAKAYEFISKTYESVGLALPENRGGGEDQVRRFRDKLVMDSVHALREAEGLPKYQSVRAAFIEGERLYENAGFRRKTHIQIAVLDAGCIKGCFRLPEKPAKVKSGRRRPA
jgi:hypothetical protein